MKRLWVLLALLVLATAIGNGVESHCRTFTAIGQCAGAKPMAWQLEVPHRSQACSMVAQVSGTIGNFKVPVDSGRPFSADIQPEQQA